MAFQLNKGMMDRLRREKMAQKKGGDGGGKDNEERKGQGKDGGGDGGGRDLALARVSALIAQHGLAVRGCPQAECLARVRGTYNGLGAGSSLNPAGYGSFALWRDALIATIAFTRGLGSEAICLMKAHNDGIDERYSASAYGYGLTFRKINAVPSNAPVVTWIDLRGGDTVEEIADLIIAVIHEPDIIG